LSDAPRPVGVPVSHRRGLAVELAPAPDRVEDLPPCPDDPVAADPSRQRCIARGAQQVAEPPEVLTHLGEPRPRPGALEALGELRAARAPGTRRVPVDDARWPSVLSDPPMDGRDEAGVLDRG